MGIPVPITKRELRDCRKALRGDREVIALDDHSYLKLLLVGREMLLAGEHPARITRARDARSVPPQAKED